MAMGAVSRRSEKEVPYLVGLLILAGIAIAFWGIVRANENISWDEWYESDPDNW
jgi:hypothetical protein